MLSAHARLLKRFDGYEILKDKRLTEELTPTSIPLTEQQKAERTADLKQLLGI